MAKISDNSESTVRAHRGDPFAVFKKHRISLTVGLGVILAAALGVFIVWSDRKSAEEQAFFLLARASTVEEFSNIVETYNKTSAAPIALLSLAAQQFHRGEYLQAQSSYQKMLDEYPEHLMNVSAVLGVAYCKEGAQDHQEALEEFDRFIEAYPDHYLAPMAQFGRARCLLSLNQADQARAVYEDFITAHTNSDWLGYAELALDYIAMDARKGASGDQ